MAFVFEDGAILILRRRKSIRKYQHVAGVGIEVHTPIILACGKPKEKTEGHFTTPESDW
jgi:hypothetical protein